MRSATKWMAAMLTICMVAGSGCGSSEPEALTDVYKRQAETHLCFL